MNDLIKKYTELLRGFSRFKLGFLIVVVLLMAIMDTLGVASILPFMAVLANPQLVQENEILNYLFLSFGFETQQFFFFALGTAVFLLLLAGLALRAIATYVLTHFGFAQEYMIGKRLVEGYLHQPYEWFLSRHSSDLGKNILSDVNSVVSTGLLQLLTLLSQSIVAVMLILLLMFVDFFLAISVGSALGLLYFVVFFILSRFVKKLGNRRLVANLNRFTVLNDAFGAVKEVKLAGAEQHFVGNFSAAASQYAASQAAFTIVSLMPRFFLEAVAFGGILVVTLVLVLKSGDLPSALPTISLYALAGYRLMPALQQIYSSATSMRFASPNVDNLYQDLLSLPSKPTKTLDRKQFEIVKGIELTNLSYNYPDSSRTAISDVSLNIPAGSFIGIVGTTGSGKTTIIDVLLGLLIPNAGQVVVDDTVISSSNRRQLNDSIGYVPQQIFLTDDTIERNIAFSVRPEEVDREAVINAAKIANLHDFISTELDLGYQTELGERGVRLSGGQRQRIGIARALYRQPHLLVLDEATSALDNVSEKKVINAIKNISHDITIIMIAHRLNTVRDCDQIHLMENGFIKSSGTFQQLIQTNEDFANMANS